MMGKTRKVPKGLYTTGCAPDYRHVVETVAGSEGFGSSNLVCMELTASEGSSACKRKCFNLNMDGYDVFGVPMQIFSLSKMSALERKDLEKKLKHELKQVRMLQKKIGSLDVDDMFYQNDNGKPSMLECFPMSINDVAVVPLRKKCSRGINGLRTKGGNTEARRTGSVKQVIAQNNNFVSLMKQCETQLSRLMSHQHGWIFHEPVDIVKHNIPDYFNVIKHPMDLGTIKRKLLSGQYTNPMGFAADVRLTFNNALVYNPPGHDVHVMAEIMCKYFETKWKPIEKKILSTVDESIKSSVVVEPQRTYLPPMKKQKSTSVENKVKGKSGKQGMSDYEKQRLGAELEAVMAELPDNIVDFLKESTLNESQISDDEIEIDIDTLSDDTLFTLRQLLDDYLLKKQKDKLKQVPCEIEINNGSEFSNLSTQHCQDHEQAGEDVDIGRYDPPAISSSIPVEADKNAVRRKSICSSSNSSSRESGSSSSDSDSGSSVHGELDDVKISDPASTENETECPKIEHKGRNGGDTKSGGASNAEQTALSNSINKEGNCCEEEGSGPPESQVSPEKLYLAALLRSRFADIIIKAQENTGEKGERPDPEKLKFEKEELERRRKEEKARLQAEAKVAEEARRKAEEEASAEAKKKRDLEREAARQALQKMEKSVDINDNSRFMEDLEMLTSAPDKQAESFTAEGSPENTLNYLASFKFPASNNPLEQLGLYIKNDDEEEEEVEPQHVMDTLNDQEGDSD